MKTNQPKYNILAVDNNIKTLLEIENFFKKHKPSIKLDVCSKPLKALEEFKSKLNTESEYDMCIIDWNMPDLTGDLLGIMIKGLKPSVKTILYTGSNDDLFLRHMDCYKFDLVCTKTLGVNGLNEALAKIDISKEVPV